MKKWPVGLLGLSLLSPLWAAETQTTSAAAAQAEAPKAAGVWIDVRSPEEYQQGHLSGAVNVSHENIAKDIAAIEPNKDAPINLYCRSGRRAEMALKELKSLGYTNVINHGGYEDLVKKGLR